MTGVQTMRRALILTAGMVFAAAAAHAQAPAAPADRGYVMGVADSSFGNVTSQSFGAEIGVTVRPEIQVFGSFGHVGDAATPEIGAAASTIAGALAQLQSGTVSYSVKQPVTFFLGGVRYRVPVKSVLQPYIAGGLGVGMVKKDVTFLINGTDATSALSQYVTLGSDVSGDESAMMFSLGGGVVWAAWQQLMVDLHYNYGRVSSDTPITINRIGIGVGIRF
jgi:opacity protein-like surface antigen